MVFEKGGSGACSALVDGVVESGCGAEIEVFGDGWIVLKSGNGMHSAEALFVHGCIMLRHGAKHGHGCGGSGGLCVADLSFCEDFSVVFSGDVDVVEGPVGEARSFSEWSFIFPFVDCSLFTLFA